MLLQHNAKVYLAARSEEKASAAIASLKQETGKDAIFLALDLSSLASIKKAAQEFLSREPQLHILFNNAYVTHFPDDVPYFPRLILHCRSGVMWPPKEMLTEEGYDLQWGIHVVGHWYFTELLMPALLAGVETSPDRHARVVTTSSSAAYSQTINWDTLKDGPARKKQSTENLYGQSKFVRHAAIPVVVPAQTHTYATGQCCYRAASRQALWGQGYHINLPEPWCVTPSSPVPAPSAVLTSDWQVTSRAI